MNPKTVQISVNENIGENTYESSAYYELTINSERNTFFVNVKHVWMVLEWTHSLPLNPE